MPGYLFERIQPSGLSGGNESGFTMAKEKTARNGTIAYSDSHISNRRIRMRRSERVVLECNCGERLILISPVAVRRSAERVLLECSCGERFTLAGYVAVREPEEVVAHGGYWETRSPGEERRYSWLEDCRERLEGKEAREEYYARLEWVDLRKSAPSPERHE
jgi:hypothetical protein